MFFPKISYRPYTFDYLKQLLIEKFRVFDCKSELVGCNIEDITNYPIKKQ